MRRYIATWHWRSEKGWPYSGSASIEADSLCQALIYASQGWSEEAREGQLGRKDYCAFKIEEVEEVMPDA